MRGLLRVAALLALLHLVPVTAVAQLRTDTVAAGLQGPVGVSVDPADPARLLVIEQRGLIRVVQDGAILPQPFLDLTASVAAGGERGLLGLAFPPDAPQSRRVFVNFTNRNGDTVIARFLRHEAAPLTVDPATRFDLVWPDGRAYIEQPFGNHNGGHLAFGPDGFLYIGLGDGGGGGDPLHHAQNPSSLLGKMLRLDVSVADDHPRGYRTPPDNPFAGGTPVEALDEIWAFGLRNPWKYSFDTPASGGTGALLIGDVGQDAREEINYEPRASGGRNYGWRLREGRRDYDMRQPPAYVPLTEPLHDYGRDVGASIIGGFVYRGARLDPEYQGRYFYADLGGRVFSLGLQIDPLTGEAVAIDEREHTEALGGRATLGALSAFGTDADGELLIVGYGAGTILRIVPHGAMTPDAPTLVAFGDGPTYALRWSLAAGQVPVIGYLIETIAPDGRRATVDIGQRTAIRVRLHPAQCVAVRARGALAISPPSAPICAR